ncbi:hypothetical protein RND71_034952 [Anisodus tanguticus]|uniref:PARP-type domain-containing protein n=1 Tax=Anisodus tanguticus TaxID=243964 RepID=A0AAE1R438_9SOLA|nr:hypothetical protein RND71_034952 [Anisodus tanguticus]
MSVRISKPEGQRAKSLAWHHAKCFSEISSATQVEKLSGWDSLSTADQAAALSVTKLSPKSNQQRDQHPRLVLKGKKANSEKSKLAKAETDVSTSKKVLDRNTNNVKDEFSKASELESQLEAQTKAL